MVHSILSLIHTNQVILGYILMLVVMSYNVWLLLAVIGGATIGYLIFSWDRIKFLTQTAVKTASRNHSSDVLELKSTVVWKKDNGIYLFKAIQNVIFINIEYL